MSFFVFLRVVVNVAIENGERRHLPPAGARKAGGSAQRVSGAGAVAVPLVLLLAAAPVMGQQDHGPEITWSERINVASGEAFRGPWRMNESEFLYVDDPSAALRDDATVGVVWADNAAQDIFFRSYTVDGDPELDEATNISRSPDTFSWLPRIVMSEGRSDHVYVLWQEIVFSGGSHGGEILFARSTDGGSSFDDPINLSNTPAGAGKGRLTRDRWSNGSLDLVEGPGGTLYAAWTEYEGALWLSRSVDAGESFSEPKRIAGGDDALPARAPTIAVGGNGRVYLAWTVGENPAADIHLVASDDGESFGEPRRVTESEGHSDAPKLAVDGNGTVHLVYSESPDGPWRNPHVRYARADDGGRFAESEEISAAHTERFAGAGFPSLAVAGDDEVYVLWELFPTHGHRSRGLGLTRSGDGGGSFAEPEIVPGTDNPELGFNGSQQGLLMRKLAVNDDGDVVVVNSTFRQREASHVWLIRGRAGP